MKKILTSLMIAALLCACSGRTARSESSAPALTEDRSAFSADSAMLWLKAQTDLGPRVPGSRAHDACVSYLTGRLRDFGADTVCVIGGSARTWEGKSLPVRNIFARYGADRPAHILLMAHYDTRPWADRDPEPANREKPIDGANDGASGVAVILEIARNLGIKAAEVGVDILLTDLEDSGATEEAAAGEDTWCLGAQDFAENLPYTPADRPRYGILLDMVGGKDARFHREYFSDRRASDATDRVWSMAARMGLGSRFIDAPGGAITDDHLPLIDAGIPVTDIIENMSAATGSFPATWHTLDDNFGNIDPQALSDVGRVVLNVIYYEKP